MSIFSCERMRQIMFWVGIFSFVFILNLLVVIGKHYLAESKEYCNEKGYWVKTSFTGVPIGIAMYSNGVPVTCKYKVADSK